MSIAGLAAARYAVAAVNRLRAQEMEQLAELVLPTTTGRIRWALGHGTIAAAVSAALLAVAGMAAGLGRLGRPDLWSPGVTRGGGPAGPGGARTYVRSGSV